jgi:lipid-binding SYLF domain-containing protein
VYFLLLSFCAPSHLCSFFPPGLAIFQVVKAGFVFSGKAGSGLVISRLPDGSWSAPSCIATGGVGWGLQVGADITDFVIVLNSEDAVRAFSMGGNVTIGGNISATAGPIGTGGSVQASLAHPAPMFSYSKSKGASFGMQYHCDLIQTIPFTRSIRWPIT